MVPAISSALSLGPVHLRTADLGLQSEFYQKKLGLKQLGRDVSELSLGTEQRELLRLCEDKNARRYRHVAGLYHFCIRVEARAELGRLLKNLLTTNTPLDGLVDHRMAEAIYLKDAEGNGIELNWDRPREVWRPWSEWLAMGNAELDVEGLLNEADTVPTPWIGIEATARIGHIHLHVGDLEKAKRFYVDVVGLDQTAEIPNQAVFTSAGGYHHHIAFNVWAGKNVEAAPADALGLKQITVELSAASDLDGLQQRAQSAGIDVEREGDSLVLHDPWEQELKFVLKQITF